MTGLAADADDLPAPPVAATETIAATSNLPSSPLPAPASVAELAASSIQALDSTAASLPPDDTEEADEEADVEALRVSRADDSYYWDPSTMAPLNARSAAAIARLRAYRPPAFPQWDRLPLSRRAAVLLLLYADRRGDLRVVLTMRAASLRNYSGHAAFPGGKADTLDETPEQIARREAWEEIGLPLEDDGGRADAPSASPSSSATLQKNRLPRGFRIEHLCALPYNLAKTELVVRPCVALLHAPGGEGNSSNGSSGNGRADAAAVETPDETLIPRLDAKEVAAVFSAPFHNFLLATDEVTADGTGTPLALTSSSSSSSSSSAAHPPPKLPPGPWYEGEWMHWHEKPWRLHFFYVPVVGQRVAKPRAVERRGSDASVTSAYNGNQRAAIVAAVDNQSAAAPVAGDAVVHEKEDEQKDEDATPPQVQQEAPGRYKVWGMTARILVDAAKLAYDETPEFEHNAHLGDEQVIAGLIKMGRLGEKKRRGSELTHEDVKKASKM